MLTELRIDTKNKTELIDITERVQEILDDYGIAAGVCHLFVPHTTAGLTLNENWDPAVRTDIVRTLNKMVPADDDYRHREGNSPAHIKATLTGSSSTLLVEDGKLRLGVWQGVYLAEFDGPRQRTVLVKIVSDSL
ncbi:MAG: secondary thiamine-phosphate synthase enzyme YjbQ [Chloroflexota bacterium]|nr:secondary thiamine-phosphate synthase enzyme YjbQ [Chloroflexota bacterium]